MKKINILHLYPDLLNMYGDKGNVSALLNRLKWRGIDAEVISKNAGEDISLEDIDIVLLGGGADKEEDIVRNELFKIKDKLSAYIENDGVFLGLCGGLSHLGKYIENNSGKTECLGILDIYTKIEENRIIGNVVLETELFDQKIVGFRNHSGRIDTGSYKPLGIDVNGESEGLIYKNVLGTYLHGPLLPKNPVLCDYILKKALVKKYPDFAELDVLNDELENMANDYIVKNYGKK